MSAAALSAKALTLKTKRSELAELFKKHSGKDGAYDMGADVLADVRGRTEELDTLQVEWDELRALADAEEKNSKALSAYDDVKRPPIGEDAPESSGDRAAQRQGRAQKSLGDLFVESAAFKEFKGNQSPAAEVRDFNLKDHLEQKTLFATTAGWAPQSLRTGFVLLSPQQMPKVYDLLPKTTTTYQVVKYMEETTYTNNAAEAAEGGQYAEGALALTEQSVNVQKFAVFLPVTDEQFADEPRARDYVNNRLGFMLEQRLDQELLTGNNTPPNILGIVNKSGIRTQAKGTDPTPDAFYKLITQIRVNGFTEPSGIVMHPTDWQNLRLLRTEDGIYIYGPPADEVLPRMFGLPIVLTTYMTLGTSVCGDFATFSELAMRAGVEFLVSNSHSDFFIKGQLAVRAQFRCAAIWYRAKAFGTVTGL